MKRAIGYCLAYLASVFLLSGCNLVVFNPKGQISTDERDLIILATGLMLLVVVPVRQRVVNPKAVQIVMRPIVV